MTSTSSFTRARRQRPHSLSSSCQTLPAPGLAARTSPRPAHLSGQLGSNGKCMIGVSPDRAPSHPPRLYLLEPAEIVETAAISHAHPPSNRHRSDPEMTRHSVGLHTNPIAAV